MPKTEAIKFEADNLNFIDIEKNHVRIKISDISSLKISSKGLTAPIAFLILGLIPFVMFFAIRADGNDGTLSLLAAIACWIIGIYFYKQLPPSKHYLQIGTKGNSWYFINCMDENLNDLISKIEKYRNDC